MNDTLEQLLLRDRLLDPQQLTSAVDDSHRTQKSLAETVIDLGYVDERRFANWISKVSGTPLVDPLPEEAVGRLERRLPPATARMRMVVPVSDEFGNLSVAMVNPLDEIALQVLRTTSASNIIAVTGVRSAIERLVHRFYPEQIDGDATLLPSARFNFDAGERIAAPWETPLGTETIASTAATPWEDEPPPAPPADAEPFEFSTETLLSSRRSLSGVFADPVPQPPSQERFGTLIAQPLPPELTAEPPAVERAAPSPDAALAHIEQRLDAIVTAIERVQRRLDALDMTLMRFMNR